MIRSCFLWCKHVIYAVAVLALLACLAEIGLRVYDSATAQVTRRELYDRGLVCKSWFLHHTLKPSRNFAVKNPDTGQRVRIAVNGMGLRGPEFAVPKPAGTYRILCLGDDSTFAQGVAEGETFCAALQAELAGQNASAPIEVINAGVPDYCPLLSYLQYRHELLSLQADLVILNFDMSDIADDYQVRRYAVMSSEGAPLNCPHPALEMPRGASRQDREGALLLPQFARQKLNVLLAERTLGEKSRSIESPRCRYLWLEDQPPDWTVHIGQALSPLAHLAELARASGARLVVAACPAPWQVSASASNGEGVREQAGVAHDALFRSRRPFQTIADFCQSRQIPFYDLSDTFVQASEPEQLYLKNAAALSPDGHALYARELAGFLRQQLPAAAPAGRDYAPLSPQARLPQR
jgi:hypothetical protein